MTGDLSPSLFFFPPQAFPHPHDMIAEYGPAADALQIDVVGVGVVVVVVDVVVVVLTQKIVQKYCSQARSVCST